MVSVALPQRPWPSQDPCDEIRGLAETAGAVVVGEVTQKRQEVEVSTYIGSGKLRELKELVLARSADVVIFDNDLSPAQVRNLEKELGVKVLDRSEVILDIFASRARTMEARLQVELAQLEYSLPRLKRMWTHLSRQTGGGIGLRGPGETQLETDRRLVAERIRDLKARLATVLARKEREVYSRRHQYTVSLVGYTNAGKSHLLNALTGANVYVKNQLFSTLDTRTRRWHIPQWGLVLLSDTVGFIRDLPHHLVASFRATLAEARHARLLLHVVDASNPQAAQQIDAVTAVLKELGCHNKPTLLVLNKIDRIQDRSQLRLLETKHSRCVAVSALTGEGLNDLADTVVEMLAEDFADAEIITSAANGKLLAYLNAHAEVYRQEFRDEANEVRLHCHLPRRVLQQLRDPTVRIRLL
ncbi:MAG: GTPase HflX [Gemmataceae bacterium]|nr:GTPase HflX [Gemmataceae bacterium]MDW8244605.1 GTPase HflX [Thermogemmata sp.]